ncbi:MAG: TlpA disulfide reductase family protein, partial [Candidatus Cloacimonadaceae bacterium]|nr:TlpA disulfide reductase family protein [Candidatus Cloacimonadaceae bacterium]
MKYLLLMILMFAAICSLNSEQMPDFRLPDMNNKDVTLQSLLGKGPVLIDFWASWCNPCKQSMPYLHELAEKYDSLSVVMISIDAAKDVSKAKNYLRSKQFNFTGLFDTDKNLAKKLNVGNV